MARGRTLPNGLYREARRAARHPVCLRLLEPIHFFESMGVRFRPSDYRPTIRDLRVEPVGREYEPVAGKWFRDLEEEESFLVLSVDEDQELVEIQHLDGDIEEIDLDAWAEMDVEPAEEPEAEAADEPVADEAEPVPAE